MNWNSDDENQNPIQQNLHTNQDQDDDPILFGQLRNGTTSTKGNGRKDLSKEFLKLHQKMQDKQKSKPTQNLAVPTNRDILMLKYGPAPANKKNRFTRVQQDEMASYKKDAMKLIFNRIERYIGNVFNEIQKKVLRDDIMKQRKELHELMNKPTGKKSTNNNNEKRVLKNNENDLNIVNNHIQKAKEQMMSQIFNNNNTQDNQQQQQQQMVREESKGASKFREMFEQKKKNIKNNYDQLFNQENLSSIPSVYEQNNVQSQKEFISLYETPEKDEILTIDNYIQENQNEKEEKQQEVYSDNEELKLPQFRDNTFESNRKMIVNNRYSSEELDDEEQMVAHNQNNAEHQQSTEEDQLIQLRQVPIEKESKQTSKQSSPILEADSFNEMSQDQQNEESQQQPLEEIIKPSIKKEATSYLTKEIKEGDRSSKGSGMVIKSSKQQDLVEMSFSDNPFQRRLSHFASQSSHQQSKDQFSNGNQNSPDFKRSQRQDSFQIAIGSKGNLISQKAFVPTQQSQNPSLINNQTLEFTLDSDKQKPKFADQLKQLMNELEGGSKNANNSRKQTESSNMGDSIEQQTQAIGEQSVEQDDKLVQIQQLMSKQFSKTQSDNENGKQPSKIQELKKRMNNKDNQMNELSQQYDISAYNTVEKTLIGKEFTSTPLGKMYRLSENEVLFEETKHDKNLGNQNAPAQQQVFKIQSKKQKQQTQMKEFMSKSVFEDETRKNEKKLQYEKHGQRLFNVLSKYMQHQLQLSIMELLKHQIDQQKIMLLCKIKDKVMKKTYFRLLHDNTRRNESMKLILKYARKSDQIQNKKIQKSFIQWKLQNQLQKEHVIIKKREITLNSFNSLALIVRHRTQQNVKSAFDHIKTYHLTVKRKIREQQQKTSVSQMIAFMQKKEKQLMNKKFQKFRKIIFLIAFDQKLAGLTKLLDSKINSNMRFALKEIVNYCIRNDAYKKQVEHLNNEYQIQKLQIAEKQIKRMFKILQAQFLKQGFQGIQQNQEKKIQQEKTIVKMSKVLNRVIKENQRNDYLAAFKVLQMNQYDSKIRDKVISGIIQKFMVKKKLQQERLSFKQWKDRVQQFNMMKERANVIFLLKKKLLAKRSFKRLQDNALVMKRKQQAVKMIQLLYTTVRVDNIKLGFTRIYSHYQYQRNKLKNQTDSIKIINRIMKRTNQKLKQRYHTQWKITAIGHQVNTDKKKIEKQFQQKVLGTVLQKIYSSLLSSAFQQIKYHTQKQQEHTLKNHLKLRNMTLFAEKIEKLYLQKIKYSFNTINSHYQEQAQNIKVQQAISKLSSVNKICEMLENMRLDRKYFYKWKNETLKSQAFEFGLSLLNSFVNKKKKQQLQVVNNQVQNIQILKTRQKIATNVIKMQLFKNYKILIHKAFSQWSQQISKMKREVKVFNLPPKATVVFSSSVERSQKKSIDSGSNQPPQILFKSNGKTNSANTSAISQKNLRYSQQDEDEQDEMYDMGMGDFGAQGDYYDRDRDSTDKMIVVKAKMSFGGFKRESVYSNTSSSHNRRYDSPKMEGYEEFKIAPFTAKNSSSQNKNLLQLMQDEINTTGKKNQDEPNPIEEYGIISNKKQNSSNKKKRGKSTKIPGSKPQSRNSKNNLNKYLSNNSSQSSQRRTRKSINGRADKVIQNEEVQKQFKPILEDRRESIQEESKDSEEPTITLKNEALQQQDLLSSSINQRLFSPRSQYQLEPVPEEQENENGQGSKPHKNQSSKRQKSKASTNNKLSNFLSSKVNTQTSLDQKTQKQKSKENNEKFKVFLAKGKNQQSHKKNTSSQDMRDTSMFTKNALKYESGIKLLSSIFYRKALEKIMNEAFSDRCELLYKQRLHNKKQKMIKRVLIIRREMLKREDYLKKEAFLIWKRSDYIMMIHAMNNFKDTLSKMYGNNKGRY